MRVRCPACAEVHSNPPLGFVCAGCGRRLAWRPRHRLLSPEQLSLFIPDGSADAMTLDLSLEDGPRAVPEPDRDGQPTNGTLPTTALQTCLALITAMLPEGEIDSDLVGAVLLDAPHEDMLELAFATAWFAAGLIRHFDDVLDGDGTLWLRSFATALADPQFGQD